MKRLQDWRQQELPSWALAPLLQVQLLAQPMCRALASESVQDIHGVADQMGQQAVSMMSKIIIHGRNNVDCSRSLALG